MKTLNLELFDVTRKEWVSGKPLLMRTPDGHSDWFRNGQLKLRIYKCAMFTTRLSVGLLFVKIKNDLRVG